MLIKKGNITKLIDLIVISNENNFTVGNWNGHYDCFNVTFITLSIFVSFSSRPGDITYKGKLYDPSLTTG